MLRLAKRLARLLFHRAEGVSFEHQILQAAVSPGDVVYDIGANQGHLTCEAAKIAGATGAIYSFEPIPATYRQLSERCRALPPGGAQVRAFQVGIGDINGELEIRVPDHSAEEASLGSATGTPFKCPFRRLDSITVLEGMPPPAFLKIDVEGAEPLVLRGAPHTLLSQPFVLMELFSPWLRRLGLCPWDSLSPLQSAGYSFIFVLPEGLVSYEPTPSAPFPPGFQHGFNVLAFVPSKHAERVDRLRPLFRGGTVKPGIMHPAPVLNT